MKDMTDQTQPFALCLNNEGYPASLEVGKLYRVIPTRLQPIAFTWCLYRTLLGRRYWQLHGHSACLPSKVARPHAVRWLLCL
jgi:hypothetical protein